MRAFIITVVALGLVSVPVWGGMLVHHLEEKRRRENGYLPVRHGGERPR